MKVFAAFAVILLLIQLMTGKAFLHSSYWLRVRLRQRPGARVWWGPVWVGRSESPGTYWMALADDCIAIAVLCLAIGHKIPPARTAAPVLFLGIAGLLVCGILGSILHAIWRPSRRRVFGIASPRTVALYVAGLLSLPPVVMLSMRWGFRLAVLFFVPFLLIMPGRMSARIDARQ